MRAFILLLLAGALALCGPPRAPEAAASPRFYTVGRRDGVWWLIAPDGRRVFSLGVNVVDRGAPRERYRPERPEYAAFRHYTDDAAWARSTLSRLRAWNFNTLGGWCDLTALEKAGELMLPYTHGLWVGSKSGVPWLDLFSEETARNIDAEVRRQVTPRRDDSRLIGYYTDNELGWWDETVFLYHTKQPVNATKRALIGILREHYEGDFSRLRRDFNTGPARRFEDLEQPARLTKRPGGRGQEVVEKFISALAGRYYRVVHDAIRRHDPNHLILGDRYISWYPPAVAKAAGPYVDVVSTNVNADWTDGAIARFHFDTLHQLTGKPILVTEYYMSAVENRSGNKNSGMGFPTVKTQAERAGSFRRTLTQLASDPRVVGAHWFQYFDEPTFGRPDGEDFNMGLVDIHDRPYEELTAAAREVQAAVPSLHERARATPAPDTAAVSIPPARRTSGEGLTGWDRDRARVAATSRQPGADLYAWWDPERLYLAVQAADYADPELYPDGTVPESACPRWIVRLPGAEVTARLGLRNSKSTAAGPASILSEWGHRTRCGLLISIPAHALRRPRLQVGDTVRLSSELVHFTRTGRSRWERSLRLVSR